MSFSQVEQDNRVNAALAKYQDSELIMHPVLSEWILMIHDKLSQGYTLDKSKYIDVVRLKHSLYLTKPASMQDDEKEAITEQVIAQYLAELNAS